MGATGRLGKPPYRPPNGRRREYDLKRIAIGALLALVLGSTAVAADKAERRYARLYKSLVETVEKNFYAPDLNGANWRGVAAHYRERLKTVRNDDQFLALGQAMLVELGSTRADLSRPSEAEADWVGIGARIWKMGPNRIVTQVDPISDARRAGLRVGDIVLSPEREMIGPAGSSASVRVKTCAGAEKLLTIRREGAFQPAARPSYQWSVLRAGPGRTIGYLRVDSFDDDGAQLADRAMADLKDTDGLIIDVRFNEGGNASGLRLASYFTEGAQPGYVVLTNRWLRARGAAPSPAEVLAAPRVSGAYTDADLARAIETNGGGAVLWTEDLAERRYAKPVIVLQAEGTGQEAEAFAWTMRLKTKAMVMGRKAAGAMMDTERFDIGEGWTLTLPVGGLWAADGVSYGARPVAPRDVIAMSRASMCAGRDGELETAIDRITGAKPAI